MVISPPGAEYLVNERWRVVELNTVLRPHDDVLFRDAHCGELIRQPGGVNGIKNDKNPVAVRATLNVRKEAFGYVQDLLYAAV